MPGDPHSGSKVWEAPDREIGKPGENRGKIVAHGDFQPTTALHNRENRRNLGSRVWTADVYPVLPAQGHRTHRILRKVVAQLKFRIFQESRKFPPQCVSAYWQALLSALEGNAMDCATSILLRISSNRGLALF